MNGQLKCDVLVVGAGVAGVAAAVTAARLGAKTILIEENNFLGGEVITGMHPYLCGLYFNEALRLLNPGLSAQIVQALRKNNAAAVKLGKVNVLRFETKALAGFLLRLTRQKNLSVFLRHKAVKAVVKKRRITAVKVKSQSRKLTLVPKSVVDCSGAIIQKIKGAALSAAAPGALGGYCFKVKTDCRNPLLGIKIGYVLSKGAQAKKIPDDFRLTQTTLLDRQTALIKMTMPFDQRYIKGAHGRARRLLGYLRKNLPEFKNSRIIKPGVLLERSGVRLNARYLLREQDVILGKRTLAPAVKNSWPVEFWGKEGVEYRYCQKAYYDIPAGCLQAKNISNLFSAGRFIGADLKAIASARVAGACLATGELAGKLAAHAV